MGRGQWIALAIAAAPAVVACAAILGTGDVSYGVDGGALDGEAVLDGSPDTGADGAPLPDGGAPDAEPDEASSGADATVLAHAPGATNLQADPSGVYWTVGAQIFVSDGGADAALLAADAATGVDALRLTLGAIVWHDTVGGSFSRPKGGTAVTSLAASPSADITASGTTMVFGDAAGHIYSCAIGAVCSAYRTLGYLYASPRLFVSDVENAYFFATPGTGGVELVECPILGGCVNGGAKLVNLNGVTSPSALTRDVDTFFWVDGAGVFAMPGDLSGAFTSLGTENAPRRIASDGSNVYWTATEGVRVCRKGACAPRTWVPVPTQDAFDIAFLPPSNIVWIQAGTGDVVRAPIAP